MTEQEIIDRAAQRFNAQQNRYGMLTIVDIQDFFDQLDPNKDRRVELNNFFQNIPYLTEAERQRILSDVESYR